MEAKNPEKPPARPPRTLRLVPREHGASFMSVHALLLGIVGGIASGGRDLIGILLSLAFGALFLPLAASVSYWSHSSLGARARRRAAILGGVYVVLSLLALARGPRNEMLILGAAAAAVALAYLGARTWKGARSIPAELAAIAGITLFAPLTWLLIAGAARGWALSAPAAFLAFGGTLPYVRERVERRTLGAIGLTQRLARALGAITWQAVALAIATGLATTAVTHPLIVAAFVPGAVKTVVGLGLPEHRPPIRQIGYVETGVSTAFAVLAGLALGMGRG